MKEAVVVSGVRTPIGAFGGALKTVPAVQLGALVMRETIQRVGLRPVASPLMQAAAPEKLKNQGLISPEKVAYTWDDNAVPITIDEVIMGNVLQAGQGQNPARQAMVHAGIPKETPAFTINKVCGSGLKSIALGASAIMTGSAEVILAGGQENMSMVPMTLPKARWGYRMEVSGIGDIVDLMVFDGLYEIFYGYHMGVTAENIVELYGIDRLEQDELSVLSHQRALKAIADGLFDKEIVPVTVKSRKGDVVFGVDERPLDTNMEKMAKLRPVFKKSGTVTAGNASGINDAAAAILMMSADKAQELGLEAIVRIKAFASAGVDPAYMGLGPVPAIKRAVDSAGMNLEDIDMIELNEAFAAQSLAVARELRFNQDKVNVNGGAIALGHPIGASGARILVTLIHEMQKQNSKYGLATLCIGGGMGEAVIVQK